MTRDIVEQLDEAIGDLFEDARLEIISLRARLAENEATVKLLMEDIETKMPERQVTALKDRLAENVKKLIYYKGLYKDASKLSSQLMDGKQEKEIYGWMTTAYKIWVKNKKYKERISYLQQQLEAIRKQTIEECEQAALKAEDRIGPATLALRLMLINISPTAEEKSKDMRARAQIIRETDELMADASTREDEDLKETKSTLSNLDQMSSSAAQGNGGER